MRKNLLLFLIIFSPVYAFSQGVGQTSITFTDAARNNRSIPCEIFYPAEVSGTDVNAMNPMSLGLSDYPAISVGHGFVIGAGNYDIIANHLVPFGFVVALVNTEAGFAPNHQEFGLDLAFVTHALQQESLISTSILHNVVNQEREAIIGHSMGGGSAWLAAASDPTIDAIVGLAPAETNPSAIAAASQVTCSALVFSGSEDAVTPPSDNHLPIFEETNSFCKTYISLVGGSHCGYIDAGTLCDFGEPFGGSLARADQQDAYLTLMSLWLRSFLIGECVETEYSEYVFANSFVSTELLAQCILCGNVSSINTNGFSVFPNPNKGVFSIKWHGQVYDEIEIFNAAGKSLRKEKIVQQGLFVEGERLALGVYWVKLTSGKAISVQKIIVE